MTATLLAFDTSTERLTVALQTPAGVYLADEPGGALASATLLPRITAMLNAAGASAADLDAIAFGRGPGAFTGLRTSGAVAQGLAFGLGKPVLAIDSLLIVAEDAHAQWVSRLTTGINVDTPAAFDVAVAMDARMDQAYAAVYRWTLGRWQVLAAPALFSLPALAADWQGRTPTCIAGSALQAFGGRLVLPPALHLPAEPQRAAALLRLAQQAWLAGEAVDPAMALPLYVRDTVALTTAEREAAK